MNTLAALSPLDFLALAVFAAAWLGYPLMVRIVGPHAINAGLHDIRVRWMREMALRDNRIVDASLIGHVVHSASFFASTSLIAIGALIGVLTGLDRLQPAIETLGKATPRALIELGILLPLVVLVHGLFQLTWALRQMNYVVALVGATPRVGDSARDAALAEATGSVLSSAIATFNAGIRSYYFALVALSWLVSPLALIAAAVALAALLLHRQRFSTVSAQMRHARALLLQMPDRK
jgi:uncharacterized membrane protein